MNHSRRFHPIGIAMMLLLQGVHVRDASAESSGLRTGAAAWQALVGNTISGRTPDGAYVEYYLEDGDVIHADRDGTDRGRWVLRDAMVCFTFPEDDIEECRTPEVDGQHGAFIDRDGSRYPFDVLIGNPKRF